jgi:hypothetical protein
VFGPWRPNPLLELPARPPRWAATESIKASRSPSLYAACDLPPDQLDLWLADWADVPKATTTRSDCLTTAPTDEEDLELALRQQQQQRHFRRHWEHRDIAVSQSGGTALFPSAALGIAVM